MGEISTIHNPPDAATHLRTGQAASAIHPASKDATQQAAEDATQLTK
jgi:hypothetical protein